MKKRIVSIILALFLAVGLIPTGVFTPRVAAADTGAAYYFRNQLKEDSAARMFYDAIEIMEQNGTLKSGTEALELTAEFPRAADFCAQHQSGAIDLMAEYGAGRDAYYADHPDVFYVDFSALTVRVTLSGSTYHLYLGAGRYPTYYTEGFTDEAQVESAIEEYQKELAKLIDAGREKTDPREQVIAVHDYLTKHVTYTDELSVSDRSHMGFIRTAYGALVNHEGVCESYTRAFKAAMDALGIPCVMVSGVYRHSDKINEAHIWNEVKIDGKWYAVDVTMDDPINPNKASRIPGDDGYENHQYLLVGEDVMSVHHYPDGAMSPGGYDFTYPSIGSEFENITDDENPLKVRFTSMAYDSEILEGGVYYVSYMGMNATDMKKNGYYLIMRNKVYDVNEGWTDTDWYYYTPEAYVGSEDFADVGNETMFKMPHVEYVEFGVTLDPYPPINFNELPDLFFHGDASLLVARSGLLHNEDGTYRAAPASLHGEPAYNRCSIGLGEDVHLVAYFNDILVTPEVYEEWCKTEKTSDPGYYDAVRSATADDISLEVYVQDGFMGRNDNSEKYQVMRNVQISFVEGAGSNEITETKVEFDYKTSDLWIDDNVAYTFFLTGLVGAYSGKAPGSFAWVVQAPCAVCAYRSQGFDYNAFAKPVLVADEDLSMTGWTDSEGNKWEGSPWDDQYKSRLMLVVEDSSPREANELTDQVESEMGEDVLTALTYNINLTLCKKQWANLGDGMSVRIQLGFPVGYGPEDAGVTFKAYHFIKDSNGNIEGVEEIPCVITPYGLLITVSSFSPFAICAVKADETVPAEKTVALISEVGGKVTSAGKNSTFTIKPGETVTVSVSADKGYLIDTVEASGISCGYSDETSSYSFDISYDDILGSSVVVSAVFVAETVAESEVGNAVIREAVPPTEDEVKPVSSAVVPAADGSVTLKISAPNENYTYVWYKVTGADEDTVVGTGSTVTLPGVDESGDPVDNTGEYYCVAYSTAGASTASTKSETVTVAKAPVAFKITSEPEADSTGKVTATEGDKVVLKVESPVDGYNYEWWSTDGAEAYDEGAEYTVAEAGVYYCKAINAYGTAESINKIEVEFVPPKPVMIGDDNRNVQPGEEVTFEFENADEEKYTYTWYKVGVSDPVGSGAKLVLSGEDISGEYYCVVENKVTHSKTESGMFNVNVQEPEPGKPLPAEFTIETSAEEIEEGQSATLSVKSLEEGCVYTWYIEDDQGEKKIGEGESITVTEAGEYFCVAENEGGTTVSGNSINITVKPKQEPEPDPEIPPVEPQMPQIIPPVHRNHAYGSYSYDAQGHWASCVICGSVSAKASHIFNANGVCTVCGYATVPDAETVIDVEAPTESPETEEDEPEGEETIDVSEPAEEDSNPKTGLAFGIFAVAAGLAAAVISKKR